ncbi:type II toxin-antitoxin system RelE/ParE family toxin [Ciceribacter sp. L1K23]|nr:type II toxin-antitoxin system RelE/ParE family toxin [Ciceribacter sp. L1K23]
MKVDFTDAATEDLAEIGRYIVEHNPSRALSYLEELRQACLEIAEMPEAFVMLSSVRSRRLRK